MFCSKIIFFGLFLLSACAPAEEPHTIPWSDASECNPIAAEWDCLLPFPSDYWAIEDREQPNGLRVQVSEKALPQTKDGAILNLPERYISDGASRAPHIAVAIPGDIDTSQLVPAFGKISDSANVDSQTLILDTQTGLFIEHFSEFFGNQTQSLAIRPLELLEFNRRYIVVVQGLKTTEGEPVAAPETFQKIRDALPLESKHDAILEHYQQRIFPHLLEAGVDQENLVLAWDFTTRSEKNATGDVMHMRRLMLEALDAKDPEINITEIFEEPHEHIAKRIEGILTVPSFLESAEATGALLRDADGKPRIEGTIEVPFILVIPHSALESDTPVRLMQFGHGFFANRSEVNGGFVTSFAQETGMVVIAIDWLGMATADINLLLERLNSEPERALDFAGRTIQGVLNNIALTRAVQTTLLEKTELQKNGTPLYDPEQIYFYGLSQGHILGGVFAALTPDINKVILSSGGASFSLIMSRAMPFAAFRIILDLSIDDPMSGEKFVALGITALDIIDPVTYAGITPLPRRPPTPTMLLHSGVEDASVPHISAIFQARSLKIPQLLPLSSPAHGLESIEGPTNGSALTIFDFDEEMPEARSLEQNSVHEALRRLPAAIEQINRYLRPNGQIEATCNEACSPD